MQVNVLGRLVVTDAAGNRLPADELPRRARQVLGVLAARYDRMQSKDSLADAVWGEDLPGNHVAALEHYISVIRRRLQPGVPASASFIVTRSGGYLFDTSRARLDLAELRRQVRLLDGHAEGSAERLAVQQQILDLAADLPFPEDEYADWASAARTEVRGAVLGALLGLAEAAVPGDPARALRLAQEAIELDGYVEQSYRLAMTASVALGRPDDALRWFERCRDVLDRELGIAPSPETAELRRAILTRRQPAAATPADPAPAGPAAGTRPGAPQSAATPAAGIPAVASPPTRPLLGGLAAPPAGPRADDPAERIESSTAGPTGAGLRMLPVLVHRPGARGRRPTGPVPFLGRRTELDLILSTDPLPVIHIVGPSGAGKSELLAELRRRAPGRVGVGHCQGSTGALRLSWLRSVCADLDADAEALAVVDRAMAERRPLSHDDLEVVAAVLGRPEPVVLAVDDAEDLDDDSVTELAWLGHRCPQLCVTLTYRYPSAIAGRPVAGLGTAVVLRLAPLTDEELAPLGSADLVERTGGIPALVAAAHRPPEVAASVAMQIARLRTRWMSDAGWEILRLCATLGSLRVGELASLTTLPLTDVLTAVDSLVHAHLLTEGPGGHVRHRSTLIRDAVAEQVSTAHGMHLRQRLAASGQ